MKQKEEKYLEQKWQLNIIQIKHQIKEIKEILTEELNNLKIYHHLFHKIIIYFIFI